MILESSWAKIGSRVFGEVMNKGRDSVGALEREWIWIGLFGLLGVMTRFGLDRGLNMVSNLFSWSLDAPWPTLMINVIGSFFAGILFALPPNSWISEPLKRPIMIGGLGGFTTFSAFSLQIFELFATGKPFLGLLYSGGSVILGVLAVFLGVKTI